MARLLIVLLRCYQFLVSPFRKPACRYIPTCSQYAINAIDLHGVWKGCWLTLKRVVRCHPIESLGGGSGYDPVPHDKLKA